MGVVGTAQPQVAPARGRHDPGRLFVFFHLFALGEDERQAAVAQTRVGGLAEPRRVPELEGRARAVGEQLEKGLEPRQVALEVGWQLEQYAAQPVAEHAERLQQVAGLVVRALEALEVRDAPRRLDHEAEGLGNLFAPALEHARPGQTIESVVDLDRGQALGVEAEPVGRLERFGVERPVPHVVAVPAGPGAQLHREYHAMSGSCSARALDCGA